MAGCLALIRVRVPDRPGALGLVASRIGALKGDIVGIEVLDRADGVALDELAVVLSDAEHIPAVIREIGEVDGAAAESVIVVDAFPEPRLDTMEAAIALSRAPDAPTLARTLATRAIGLLSAEWCAIIAAESTITIGDRAPSGASDIAALATFSAGLGSSGATLHLRCDRDIRPGEQRLLAGYCELAGNLWERLPAAASQDADARTERASQ